MIHKLSPKDQFNVILPFIFGSFKWLFLIGFPSRKILYEVKYTKKKVYLGIIRAIISWNLYRFKILLILISFFMHLIVTAIACGRPLEHPYEWRESLSVYYTEWASGLEWSNISDMISCYDPPQVTHSISRQKWNKKGYERIRTGDWNNR